MIGTCGFTRIDCKNQCGEAGYVLNKNYWGQGLATEALSEIIRFAFEVLKLERLESRYMEENTASRRVMEKAGMTFEGFLDDPLTVKGQQVSVGICAITRSEYQKEHNLIGFPLHCI